MAAKGTDTEIANRGITAGLDVGKNASDRVADFPISSSFGLSRRAALEILRGVNLLVVKII